MANIDRIRQEIERCRAIASEIFEENSDTYYQGKAVAYNGPLFSIDSLSEEKLSEDLEEAAEEYADKHGFRVPYDGSNNYYDDVDVKASKEGFLAGAEWQKEQMMKDAVEGTVHHVKTVHYIITNQDQLNNRLKQFEEGDNVKIIIVKQ